jgi:hypothetical protein
MPFRYLSDLIPKGFCNNPEMPPGFFKSLINAGKLLIK